MVNQNKIFSLKNKTPNKNVFPSYVEWTANSLQKNTLTVM